MPARERGATLAELLVALCLTALLAAGLLRALAGGLGAAARTQAALGAQRNLRRAVADLSDDLQQAGFLVPFGPRDPGRPLLAIEPARPVPRLAKGAFLPPAPDAPQAQAVTFIRDVVLPGRARLGAAVPFQDPPAASLRVEVVVDRGARVLEGDVLLVEDGGWEGVRVEAPAALPPGRPAPLRVGSLAGGEAPAFRFPHGDGAAVTLLRPLRLIRYGLVALGDGRPLPSLVRVETACPGPGEEPDWAALCRGPTARVVAENMVGFRVDAPGDRVRIALEASAPGPSPPRRTAILARALRNGRAP